MQDDTSTPNNNNNNNSNTNNAVHLAGKTPTYTHTKKKDTEKTKEEIRIERSLEEDEGERIGHLHNSFMESASLHCSCSQQVS